MKLVQPLAVATLALAAGACHAASPCSVRTFGAKGDGRTKDTYAIQRAIDTCSQRKRTIVISSGVFVSGPLMLKSNTTLRVEPGAVLLGSPDHEDYAKAEVLRAPGRLSLINSDHAEHVIINGGGVIDGNGSSWWAEARKAKDAGVVGADIFRPRLAVFSHTNHIVLENITFQNSPSWQIVPYYADDVVIRHVRILAPRHAPNTDAIDPFSSTNVVIDHVYADVDDDNIAIKSGLPNSPGGDAPSRNITITDCEFLHGHGLSIGSEVSGGVQNVRAERIRFTGTDQGIRVKSNRDRGNDIGNFIFRDITMRDVKTAILLTEFYPKIPDRIEPAPVTRLTPHFHDITIENVTAEGSQTAAVIVGLPESPMQNVVLRNVHLAAKTGAIVQYAEVHATDFTVTPEGGDAIHTGAGVTGNLK